MPSFNIKMSKIWVK